MILFSGLAKRWLTRKPQVLRLVERPVIFRDPVKEILIDKKDVFYTSQRVIACRVKHRRCVVFGAESREAARRVAAQALRKGRPRIWQVDVEDHVGGNMVRPNDLVEYRITEA